MRAKAFQIQMRTEEEERIASVFKGKIHRLHWKEGISKKNLLKNLLTKIIFYMTSKY